MQKAKLGFRDRRTLAQWPNLGITLFRVQSKIMGILFLFTLQIVRKLTI